VGRPTMRSLHLLRSRATEPDSYQSQVGRWDQQTLLWARCATVDGWPGQRRLSLHRPGNGPPGEVRSAAASASRAWSRMRATPCRHARHACEDAGSAAAGTHALSVSQSNGGGTQRVPAVRRRRGEAAMGGRACACPCAQTATWACVSPPPLMTPRATSSSPRTSEPHRLRSAASMR
jgi:hypothetical protein